MVQECLPLLIFGRLAETNGVAFEIIPSHQQEVTLCIFETVVQFV